MSRPGRARRRIAWWLWLCAAALACGPEPEVRPNLVVIIADDLGYPDAGFMGSPVVETPHIDRLAAEGTVFTTAYDTASTCRPSLLSLLTGLQPYQVELRQKQLAARGRGRSDPYRIVDFETLPGLLARRGYRSFQAGKHWEGSARQAGFDDGTRGARVVGGPLERLSGGRTGLEIGRTTLAPVWAFLAGEPTAGGDPEASREPFLLWFAPMLPHTPMDAPAEIVARYEGAALSDSARAYYANISRLDDVVGELMARLTDLGVLDRTLVVFLSDNGWDNAPTVDYARGRGAKIGGVHGKMSMHELGFRTPLVFRWPGRVPAGRRIDALVSTLDLFPTLLDYAGLRAPPGREGRSLRPILERREEPGARTVYGHMERALSRRVTAETRSWEALRRRAWFARSERWHYIHFPDVEDGPFGEEEELYDLANDPDEETDVARAQPEVVARFRRELEAWQQRMRASLPRRGAHRGAWNEAAAAPEAALP